MTSKIIEILKDGNIIVPKLLLTNYQNLKITEKELIVLIYLINNNDFDPEKISNDLKLKTTDILTIISSLSKKDIIKIKNKTISNIREEYISLDELYNKLALLLMEEKEEKNNITIYDTFEKEFARTLSPMEYEIISAWIESNYTEEIILLALKEAIYNGVTNLRYIDKILSEWRKKGIKTKEDIDKDHKNFNKKETKKEVYDYDWLNE